MPTIKQLPLATLVAATDEVPLSQGGLTRSAKVGLLLAGTQASITLTPGALLGRVSASAGGPEPVAAGVGLAVAGGALTATAADHPLLPVAVALSVGDEVIVNSGAVPRRMPAAALRGLFSAGTGVQITPAGVISAPANGGSGVLGPQGVQGPKGDTGATGALGAAGPAGAQGLVGATGAAGATGATGAGGTPGVQGLQGLKGDAGATGLQGAVGSAGALGGVGPAGPQGVAGSTGPVGAAGTPGAQGVQGLKGDAGATGLQGTAGAVGLQGPVGSAGAVGPVGSPGSAGAVGAQGTQGTQGPQGLKGDTGVAGVAGAAAPVITDASPLLVTASGATTARSLAARAADSVNVLDDGAALDGTADDTAKLAAARARAGTRPVVLPSGVANVTAAITDLLGRYAGPGQIQTGAGSGAGHKRAPMFARRTTAPASYGDQGDIDAAFDGDLSTVHLAIEHRIEGDDTLTKPTTAYVMRHENSAISLSMLNQSGWNQATNDQAGGCTGVAAINSNIGNVGQGDAYFLHVGGFVAGTKAGSTHFLANPALVAFSGDLFSFADGTYQEVDEFSHDDGGFGGTGSDIAVSSTVRNFNRSNDTGAKGAWWLGIRYQTAGAKAVDVGFQLVGRWKNGLDTTAVIPGPGKAIWTQGAGQRTYLNATPFADGFSNPAKVVMGNTYTHYNPATSAYEIVVGGVVALSVPATMVSGVAGLVGPAGPTGPAGATGATGTVGATGSTGSAGPQGIAGSQGLPGPTGTVGQAGPAGAQGIQGLQGPLGNTGAVGATGPVGAAGSTGAAGPAGPTAAATASSIGAVKPGTALSVAADGTLSVVQGTTASAVAAGNDSRITGAQTAAQVSAALAAAIGAGLPSIPAASLVGGTGAAGAVQAVAVGAGLALASGTLSAASGSAYLNNALQSGAAGALPRLDIYTTPGSFTWTKLATAAMVDVILIGAGGGGGNGVAAGASTAASGGGGGGAGPRVAMTVPAALLATSVAGNVTAGGLPATPPTTNTTFGPLTAYSGGAGANGQAASPAVGGAGGGANGLGAGSLLGAAASGTTTALGGGSGGQSSGSGAAPNSGTHGLLGGPAGGAAGAGTSTSLAFAGSYGGVVVGTPLVVFAAIGANGQAASAPPFGYSVGASGGGGASSTSGNGGNAGAGSGYGAGGSGGGSCWTGTAGAGAAGMPGLVMVVQR